MAPPPSSWQRPLPEHIAAQVNTASATPSKARERNAGFYGQASFASLPEVDDAGLLARSEEDVRKGIYLGRGLDPYALPAPGEVTGKWFAALPQGNASRPLAYTGENNIVTIAPAGSGKGAAAVIPTLLTCSESMFVLDVKGENWFVSAPARHAMGHELVLIDPFEIWGDDDQLGPAMPRSAQFNPLEHLRPSQKRFISEIESLAAAIIVVEGKDPHWGNRARQLLSCLMAFVCSDSHELARGNNNLPYVRQVLGKSEGDFADYMTFAAENSPLPIVRDNAASFTVTDSREVSSIKSTAIGQLGFLNHEGIRRFLSGSSFRFSELRERPMTIFCMFPPDELDTYYRFARLMVQCFFNSLSKTPKENDRRVLALLDEQAKLRRMEIIETSIALLRGYKVRIWSIFQDITQIQSLYDKAWETFISNAGVVQIMTPNASTTADYVSKRTGSETITEEKVSVSTPPTRAQDPIVRGGSTTSENSFERPFLTAQNLYAMPKDRCLLFLQGMEFPILTSRESYHAQQQPGFFYGHPYAPHPVHNGAAFRWMGEYLNRYAAAS